MSNTIVELLFSEMEKWKIGPHYPDLGWSCRHGPVNLLGDTDLILQIPLSANTSLPVWESVRAAQVEVEWTVSPYSINICITPFTSPKAKALPQTKAPTAAQPMTIPGTQSLALTTVQPSSLPPLPAPLSQTLSLTQPLTTAHPQPPLQPITTAQGAVTNLLYQPGPRAEWVQQACFYTRPSGQVCICDHFLLGWCPNGFDCEQHHTPYPFHWQLWCQDTYQWVSTSHSAQVRLERLYCDKDRDIVRLQEGNWMFTLNFDTMTVGDSGKYGKARRLSNSSNAAMNPYFPTEWRYYWWNDYTWEKYKEDLVFTMEAGDTRCRFFIGKQQYELDLISLIQTNLSTGFKRRVRRRPTFRSPFSIKSHLKTGEASQPTGEVLASVSVDPLQEFNSWYPPVWTLSPGQDFSLLEVPPSAEAYQKIHSLFHSTMSEIKMEIVSIQQVQNKFQWDKYRRQKEHMQSHSGDWSGPLERHLFHGTTEDAANEICMNNFDPRVSGKNGVAYGRGSYFARDASYSNRYAPAGTGGYQHMFLAKVLVGKTCVGNINYCRPPRLHTRKPRFELYDACVNQAHNPSVFVVFDSCQCYPYYLIKYKATSDVVKVFE
ncbi:protein mono-ADP-ribosyltransferase TIPARP-like [Megalops cyprinoides]|uniref:protein mono-ADP-ribosyltransferase TIPARP-like n=1 Tax=Megalops cyprinoides TaxID=118141 RepID=UPI001864EA2A|nr:protein mono-ADP-ribosyltransferase TIPARP-like [Megalops cyprinoides]